MVDPCTWTILYVDHPVPGPSCTWIILSGIWLGSLGHPTSLGQLPSFSHAPLLLPVPDRILGAEDGGFLGVCPTGTQ